MILGSIYLSRNEIHQSLLSINVNKDNGPDNIPPIFLKKILLRHYIKYLTSPSMLEFVQII